MKFAKSLLKDIPIEKRDVVLDKIKGFATVLLQSKSLIDIPKGFWIRKVAGTDIYKFRVNSGDRVLFKYENIQGMDDILFIAFCNHDEQIHTAKNYKGISTIDMEIDKHEYEEDELDAKINEYIKNEVYSKLAEIKNNIIIEDEYISVAIEEQDIENIYLSQEQYDCLGGVNRPNIIFGCAGSGKTMVAIRKLIFNNEINIKTVYITCSTMIINKTREMYSKCSDNEDFISFYTLRQLCREITGLWQETIVDYQDFCRWVSLNGLLKEEDSIINIREAWVEINTVIKGSARGKSISMLSKDEYLNLEGTHFNIKQRKRIYNTASMYNHWLVNNNYYDDNDLAAKALQRINSNYRFDYVVYDEIQDLTSIQLLLVGTIANNVNNIMLLGDTNQSINIERFNLDYIKNLIYKSNSLLDERFILKNYRNGSETINWINEFKKLKNSKFRSMGKNFEQEEIPIKEGFKPRMFYSFKREEEFFHKIKDDANSIVIVADESDKARLKENGYDVGRIFTIEDVRGLDYNNIYCYNLLSGFNNIWHAIFSSESKCDDLYSVYFNMVYIAVTRAKNKLCFLEESPTMLDSHMKRHWDLINNEDIILNEIGLTKDYIKWIEEAVNLEKMEKYYQAAEAYKKAGRLSDADICLKAHERKLNYKNTEKFASYVLIESARLNNEILEQALNGLQDKYDLSIRGYIEIVVDFISGNGQRAITRYIEDSINNREIAGIIYNALDLDYIIKSRVAIKVCFYKKGSPVDTSSMGDESFRDLYITCKNGLVSIEDTYYERLRLSDTVNQDLNKQYLRLAGINSENEAFRLRNDAKYESKTPDEILDYIFNGTIN